MLKKVNGAFTREYIKVSSYCGTSSADTPAIGFNEQLRDKLHAKHILVIDDIYDTGKTLSMLRRRLMNFEPQSVKTCVLLEKEITHSESVMIDFLGMKVPDVFVIGYGMDYNEQYRQLPFIAELAGEYIEE